MKRVTPEQIDELLPQTQCGLCGYSGCMPYAEAVTFENAPINLCSPGGVKTLRALGELLNQDPTPYIPDMESKTKPKLLARIREAECIGCTKCIQVCPVDAILGSGKQMHSVISNECTGCDLCVPACPVDCIDMIGTGSLDAIDEKSKTNLARKRYQAREKRLTQEKNAKQNLQQEHSLTKKRSYVQEAIARAKAKKLSNRNGVIK